MATPEENANVRFKIGDDEYEIPPVDDFDMDEWQLIYSYSGLVLEDFAAVEDEEAEKARQRRVGQPAFMRSLLHIGYRRAHPEAKEADIRTLTGEAKMSQLFQDAPEGDAGPPEITAASESPPASSGSANGSESSDSPESSDEPVSLPETTGTPG